MPGRIAGWELQRIYAAAPGSTARSGACPTSQAVPPPRHPQLRHPKPRHRAGSAAQSWLSRPPPRTTPSPRPVSRIYAAASSSTVRSGTCPFPQTAQPRRHPGHLTGTKKQAPKGACFSSILYFFYTILLYLFLFDLRLFSPLILQLSPFRSRLRRPRLPWIPQHSCNPRRSR